MRTNASRDAHPPHELLVLEVTRDLQRLVEFGARLPHREGAEGDVSTQTPCGAVATLSGSSVTVVRTLTASLHHV